MARQAEHLVTATERPRVRVGVIPWTRAVTHPVLHAFRIYAELADYGDDARQVLQRLAGEYRALERHSAKPR